MSDTMHISRRVQLDILIREKESELKRLRKELAEYTPRESDWRCVAQIKGDILRLESYRKSGGDLRRFAMRLLIDEFRRRDVVSDGMREVTSFDINTSREQPALRASWIPLQELPVVTTVHIEWDDGTKFASCVELFEDEWTEAVR